MKNLFKATCLFIFFLSLFNSPSKAQNEPRDTVFDIDKTDADRIRLILQNNIMEYFDLSQIYNTKLRKSNFLQSSESKPYKDSLLAEKKRILKRHYRILLEKTLDDYNINKGVFDVELSSVLEGMDIDASESQIQFTINEFRANKDIVENFWFPSLPIVLYESSRTSLYGALTKFLRIKINRRQAESLEKQTISMEIDFSLSGQVIQDCPVAKDVELKIFDDSKVYYSNKFH